MKKNKLFLIALLAITTIFSSCELAKEEEDGGKGSSTSTFVNKITFGTGINAQTQALTGVDTSFSKTEPLIYFRLESKEDQLGRNIKIVFKKDNEGFDTKNFTATQTYGHIFNSSFAPPQTIGRYILSAYLVKDNTDALVVTDTLIIK